MRRWEDEPRDRAREREIDRTVAMVVLLLSIVAAVAFWALMAYAVWKMATN